MVILPSFWYEKVEDFEDLFIIFNLCKKSTNVFLNSMLNLNKI